MHGFPEWFVILMVIMLDPVSWGIAAILLLFLIIFIVKKIKNRNKEVVITEVKTIDLTK